MKTSFLSTAILFFALICSQFSSAQTAKDILEETVKTEMQTINELVKLNATERAFVQRHIMAREKNYSAAVYNKDLNKPAVQKAKSKIDAAFMTRMASSLSEQQLSDLKPYFIAKQLNL